MRNFNNMAHVCSVVLVAITGVCTISVNTLKAAPVTFRFEAEIDSLSGVPFDSGINFSVGDIVSGQFTFEQSTVGDGSAYFEGTQPRNFSLNINGVVVLAPTFDFRVFNDTPILDFPPASEVDTITLGAGGLVPLRPELFPDIDASRTGFRMRLYAPNFTLAQASLPGSAAVWNDFNLTRQLGVVFRSGSGDVVGFQATVRPFLAVPEPMTGHLAFITIVLLVLSYYAINPLTRDKGYKNAYLEVLEK